VVVSHLVQAHGLSERRACRLADLNLSTWQYRSRTQGQSVLRERLKELAAERRRFGYRRLHALLCREGWRVNHKAVHRIYVEEGLQWANARGSGWPGSSVSPCWRPQRRTSAGPWTSSTISWPRASACGRSTSSTTSAENVRQSRSTPRCPAPVSCGSGPSHRDDRARSKDRIVQHLSW
jgi:hypothetical protein